jgi:glyoxylase-like metal-dependent hydrolase (beta-lactamase superfamily II)
MRGDMIDEKGRRKAGARVGLFSCPKTASSKSTGVSFLFEQITKDIYRIKVALPDNPLKSLNSYVLMGKERNLIIDLGFNRDRCFADLSAGLRALDPDMDRTDIFLTHFHSDHCGLVHRIAQKNTRIYMGQPDTELNRAFLLEKIASWERTEKTYIKAGYTKGELLRTRKSNPAFADMPERYYETEAVREGDAIDLGGLVLRVLHTPGHTPGHMCLFDEESGILFSGDHILFDITPNISDWELLDDALGSYMEHLKRVRQMPVRKTLTGHRENDGDTRRRIDEILEHHDARLCEAEGILARESDLTAYEIAARMTWSVRFRTWEDFPLGQKWFAVGEALAHLKHLLRQGRLRREEHGGQYRYFLI